MRYPMPQEVGVRIPIHVQEQRFCAGFEHGLKGLQLNRAEHLQLSFREGFRAAKLYLKTLRRTQGVVNFPRQGRIRFRVQH